MPKKEALQVTAGTAWRKAREIGTLCELPSGNVARLRRLSLLSLIKQGAIPDPLSAIVNEMIKGQEKRTVDLNTVQEFAALLEAVCKVAFIEPKIVDDPRADDEISIEDVAFDDQLYVFNEVQGEVRFMQPFRRAAGSGDVETGSGSGEVPDQAEPDSRD